MTIFKVKKNVLSPVSEKKLDLEKDIQKLTESNLRVLFGINFVSGASNREFSVKALEQEFYIDTLAFDESQKSFVIIEYKKDKSFSVIDQGFAYLSAMLNHKADFVLELNERLNKSFTKNDIDWEQSRIIFVSSDFTNYQRNAINFKDLPIFLYEVKLYEDDIIEFDPIKPYKTTESITRISKDLTIQRVSKEIKVYSLEDLIKPDWSESRELYEDFDRTIKNIGFETRVKFTKVYIAYMSKHGRNQSLLSVSRRFYQIIFKN